MLAATHTNVTIDFSGDVARFLGNEEPATEVPEPSLNLENAWEKEYGYGQSRGDSANIDLLIKEGREAEAEAEIDRIAKAAEIMGLSPEDRAHELRYQQYARYVGDI